MLIYDALFFAAAIILLLFVLQLRQLLARVFPTVSARMVRIQAPKGLADLYDAAHEELKTLGLEGPIWLMLDYEPNEAGLFRVCAVYRHAEEQILAWLFPPADLKAPNRLLTYWSSSLIDGRTLISQAFDPYFESLAIPSLPARTIHGKSFGEQIEQHREFRAGFVESGDPGSLREEGIIRLAGETMNRQRDALVEKGGFWSDSSGVVRARLGMAARMLWFLWRRKNPGDPAAPVPASRLALLARVMERARRMEPGMEVQLGLFIASVALSVGLGAILWGLQFALVLLLVLILHELGHYLAMRFFGYRNVHMLALPLVGGVTMGLDENPSAARRAWVSLMGPVPGIILGWALAYLAVTGSFAGDAAGWMAVTILLFLLVNYLNILPMLPLDGGHVVQALLPPRWINVQAVVLAVTCIVGIGVALVLDLYILVILGGLQLFALGSHFKTGAAMRRLLDRGVPPRSQGRSSRLLNVLRVLEEVAGPTAKAQSRIAQAEQILQTLDTQPMSWAQRGVIGTLYAALLAAPVAAALFAFWVSWEGLDIEELMARNQEIEVERVALAGQARGMTLEALVEDIGRSNDGTNREGRATEEAIQAAEQRLGVDLPEPVRELYRLTDGMPGLGIVSVGEIESADSAFAGLRENLPIGDTLTVTDVGDALTSREVSLDRAARWLCLSRPGSQGVMTLIDPARSPAVPGMRVFTYEYGWAVGYPSLRARIEEHWTDLKAAQREAERHRERKLQALEKLADADLTLLLGEFQPFDPVSAFFAPQLVWPEGASAATIGAAEDSLGLRLPPDLRELYGRHDGVPLLGILSLQEVGKWRPRTAALVGNQFPDGPEVAYSGDGGEPVRLESGVLLECAIIGGVSLPVAEVGEPVFVPRLLWCPRSPISGVHYVDLDKMEGYPTVTDFLRDSVAEQRAW